MLTTNDILIIIGICIVVNFLQPIINNFCLKIFKKYSEKLVGWLLKHAVKQIHVKKAKLQQNLTPIQNLQNKGATLIQAEMPMVIDQFQKNGLEGIFNLIAQKINNFLNTLPIKNTNPVQIEDVTEEADELEKYRSMKTENMKDKEI